VGQIGSQSLCPNVNSPDQLAPGGASCGADNQLAQLACRLALPKLNRSNVMIMSNRKPNVWLVTLDTNSPHVLRRVGYWGELAVGELTVA